MDDLGGVTHRNWEQRTWQVRRLTKMKTAGHPVSSKPATVSQTGTESSGVSKFILITLHCEAVVSYIFNGAQGWKNQTSPRIFSRFQTLKCECESEWSMCVLFDELITCPCCISYLRPISAGNGAPADPLEIRSRMDGWMMKAWQPNQSRLKKKDFQMCWRPEANVVQYMLLASIPNWISLSTLTKRVRNVWIEWCIKVCETRSKSIPCWELLKRFGWVKCSRSTIFTRWKGIDIAEHCTIYQQGVQSYCNLEACLRWNRRTLNKKTWQTPLGVSAV